MKGWSLLLVSLAFAGCGIDRLGFQGSTEQLKAEAAAAERKCDVIGSPDDPKTAVARAKCQTEAWAILRPVAPYPDIVDTLIAKRMAIAEQAEKGQLTIAQANEQAAKMQAELKDEEERRLRVKRSVITQPAPGSQRSIVGQQPVPCQQSGDCY
jgi:hypothetical protein